MHIHLPSDVEELVRRKVEAGEYETPSDLVIDAIHLLNAHDRVREQQLDDLRREIALGIEECERGETAELDIEEIIREGRRSWQRSVLYRERNSSDGKGSPQHARASGPHQDLALHRTA